MNPETEKILSAASEAYRMTPPSQDPAAAIAAAVLRTAVEECSSSDGYGDNIIFPGNLLIVSRELDRSKTDHTDMQNQISLHLSENYLVGLDLLARDEGLTKGEIIGKAISMYARCRLERKQGNFPAFVKVEDGNKVSVESVLFNG